MRRIVCFIISIIPVVFSLLNHPVTAQTTVLTEGFEYGGGMPAGWTNQYVTGTVNWAAATGGNSSYPATAHGGNYNALFFSGNYNGNTTKLVTPVINLGAYAYCVLDFYHSQVNWLGDCDTLKVYYKTSAGGTWTLIQTFSGQVLDWHHRTLVLPNSSATYYLGFEGISDYGYGVCIDDVVITGYPTYLLNAANNGTTVNTCGAMLFDSGGPTGDYVNNENYTMTFTSNSGGCIRAVLQYYNIEKDWDFLYFYDGTSTAAPQIGERVTASPGEIVSTIDKTGNAYYALSGSLTVKFTSDNATIDAGFRLKIDCPENCVSPPTSGTIPAADNCGTSTPICDFNGYSGNTDSTVYTTDHAEIDAYNLGIFCGGINNNSWLSFVAESSEAVLDVWVTDCQGSFYGTVKGIQLEVFDTDCNTFLPKSNCWSPSEQINGQITATGLTPGNTYLLMIDGYAKDNCKYVFSASQGLLVADAGNDETICEGDYVQLVASGGTSVTWSSSPADPSLAGQANDFTIWVTPSQTTTYTATVTGSNPSCPGLADVTVYVDAANASYTGLAPGYCVNGTSATLTPSPTGGAFSGTGVSGNSFNPATAGTGTHDVTYTYNYSVVTVFSDDFDPSPVGGWVHGATGTDSWATGKPKGGNGTNSNVNSNKDPLIDHTSNTDNNVYGQGISAGTGNGVGGYNNSSTEWLKTPAINCSSISNTTLSFWRYANFEPTWDEAYVKISTDNTNWTTLPEPDYPTDDHWVQRIINISQYADGQPTVYIRWISVSDGSQTYSGWNIDDIKITGVTTGGSCTSTDVQTTIVSPVSTGGNATASPATICSGSTSTLSVSGHTGTVQWQESPNGSTGWADISGATSSNYSTPALSVTTYYRAVITSGSCTASNSTTASVTVSSPSTGGTASVSASPLCYNSAATVSLTGNTGTIQWQQSPNGTVWTNIPGATSSSYTSGNLTSTTYFQAVVTNSGCSPATSTAVSVTINPDLTACTIGTNQSICSGQTPAGLTQTVPPGGGTGNYSYQWQYSTDNTNWFNISSATGSSYNPPSLTVTTYYRCAVTSGSCGTVNSNTVIITINANPSANAGIDQNINNGTNTTLSGSASGGSGSYSYSWSPSNMLVNASVQNPQTVNLTNTTVYTLTTTDNISGCTGTDQVTIYIIGGTLAVTGSANDYTICNGSQVQLLAVGSGGNPGNYQYTWSSNPPGFSSNLVNPTVNPTVTTVYTVSLFDNFNTVTDTVNVTVYSLPAASAGLDAAICSGSSTTLTATGGTNYSWSNGAVIATQTVTPVSTTIFTVTVTNANGCTASDAVIVTVNTLPVANAGNDQAVCAGTSVTLTASGGSSYQWSNSVSQGIPFTPAATNTYTVTVTDANNCSATDNVTVTVNAMPAPVINGSNSVCQGSTITYFTTNITDHTYAWTITGGTPTSGTSSSVDITWSNPGTGTINLTETITATSCSAVATALTVTVNATPVADAGQNVSICNGASTTLTATGGGNYSWSNGAVSASQTVSPVITTSYTVTVNSNGCTDSDTVTVTVNPNPVADAGINQNIPNGTSTSLSGTATGSSGPFSYTWSPSGSLNNANIQNPQTTNLSASTVFSLTVTDVSSGCTATDQVTIFIVGGPLSVEGKAVDYSICYGDAVVLEGIGSGGNPPYDYTWTANNSGFISHSSDTVDYPSGNTIYTLTLFDGSNQVTDTVTVTVNQVPTADAGNNQTVCSGASVTLTATGGNTYSWDNGVTQGAAFTPIQTNTYNVTVTNPFGCSATDNVTVTVNPVPTADAGTNQTVCSGSNITLHATGGTTYQWSNGAIQDIPFVINTTTLFTVTVTNASNCSATDNITITVNQTPTVEAGNNQTVCAGTTVTLTATGGGTFLWDNGITQGIPFTPLQTTTYTVTATSSGCSATDSITVTVNPVPIANAGADQTVCAGSGITLTASGGTTYQWNNGVSQGVAFTVNTTATYTVTVTNSYSCTATDNVIIIVNPLPVPQITGASIVCGGADTLYSANVMTGLSYLWNITGGTPATSNSDTVNITWTASGQVSLTETILLTSCSATTVLNVTVYPMVVADAGPDSSFCAGGSANLDATSSTGTPVLTYSWDHGLGSNPVQTVAPSSTTVYSLTVTDGNNCKSTDSIIVSVFNPPVAVADGDERVCKGTSVTLDASLSSGDGPLVYQWNNTLGNDITHTFTADTSATFIVIVTDANACQDADTLVMTVLPAPVYTVETVKTSCVGNNDGSAEIKIISAKQPVTYNWGNSTTTPHASDLSAGKYNVTVTDSTGCSTITAYEIRDGENATCLEIPSAFTPNGDSNNDKWEIKNIDLFLKFNPAVEVYNRWGAVVFKSNNYADPENFWDGTYNGNDLPAGPYVYILNLNNDTDPIQGVVTIIR